jgi:predicted enzyme related to lactoylglutathione lyase
MFARDGVPVAGGMGPMGDQPASNAWQVYLSTPDVAATVAAAGAAGAEVLLPGVPVADLGVQAVMIDPTGAHLGAWQAGTFPGFTVLNEAGAPSWFELLTRDHAAAMDFYRSVFHLEVTVVGDSDEFRYSTQRDPEGGVDLAGVGDARSFLPEGVPAHWSIYWEVEDVDAAVDRVTALGGSVVLPGQDSPYGRLATVRDPVGAEFKLRRSPAPMTSSTRTPSAGRDPRSGASPKANTPPSRPIRS